jgi:hypothetical protein
VSWDDCKLIDEIVQEMEVRTNLPAISMEEAVPLVVSSESLKAPQEFMKGKMKTDDLKADNELTREDRHRLRIKRKKQIHKEVVEQKKKTFIPDVSKFKPKESKGRGRQDLSDTKLSKSKDIFSKLQQVLLSRSSVSLMMQEAQGTIQSLKAPESEKSKSSSYKL